jgi:hypothetical protein
LSEAVINRVQILSEIRVNKSDLPGKVGDDWNLEAFLNPFIDAIFDFRVQFF